ncbi:MAG: efflux RND transporter permease subunit [Alphaproteobacteria bacterium]|uniref:Efflux RND transporter permease subunit n=1 Tax=Candidatus Nitrobium versatile TaxID=2884831 RepID=A0A953M3W9_9BACT|nr:efflux RND transporter permease subunit [Candidatus Nitrobium versatile]
MLLSDLSIKRPVFAAVMMLTLVTLGLFSYRRLSVEMYPNVEIPVVSVVTKFPGASPESVEREVTKKIEEAVNPIAGVKHVVSYSREGVSTVVVQFRLEERINDAAQEARAKINAVRGELPQGIEDPIIQKIDFNALPVLSLAVQSKNLSRRDLTLLVEKKIKRRIETIAGVGKVDVVGGAKREVNVIIEPARLEALGIGVDTVVRGLRSENVNTPLGRLSRSGSEYPLRVEGKPGRVEQFGAMVIGERNGTPVRLADVAEIRDGIEEERSLALVNGLPAVALDIQKQSGANMVEMVDRVLKSVQSLQRDLPAGVTLTVVRDASTMTRDSLKDVQETMIIGGVLTVLIVFCFINSWRSTVITGLTLPISVISSFIILHAMGMTLNIMTLMALSLAIGLLIDDAIVVRENIVRHLEKGEDHFTAARTGTSEIGLAVLATTLSITAVFVPVAFMKGIVGRFFFSFGVTVTFAVLVSLLVSFTLDPMLSSRWHDPAIHKEGRRSRLSRLLDRFNDLFDRIAGRYRGVIGWALRHRKTVLAAAGASFLIGLLLFGSLESSFMTDFDKGEFQINFKTAPDASLEESRDRLHTMLVALKDVPEIAHTYGTVGAGDSGTVRSGLLYLKLTERSARKRDQYAIQRDVRERLRKIPGITFSIEDAGKVGSSIKPLVVNVRGEDIGLLKKYAAALKEEMYKIPGMVDIEVSLEHDIPEYRLRVDREKAANTGVTTADIVRTVGALVGGESVSTFEDEDGDAVDVRVRLPESLRRDPAQVSNLRLAVQRPQGPVLVPLGNIVSHEVSATPSEINRQALSREIVVSANLDTLPLGTAVEKVKKAAERIPMEPGYRIVFSGESEDMAESFGYMAESLLLAVLLVYLILAAQFESFLEPLSIMLSLPLSIVGMAGMLFLTRDTVNIMSLIGLIMLMGLVTKNAILLVDYAKVLRGRGMGRSEAVITAGRTRLRPIIMTTLAMIFGMLPLAFALGAGAEMRAPMARAVIGGLLTSTLLTLLVVPVMYTVLDDLETWLKRKLKGADRGAADKSGARRATGAAALFLIALLPVLLPDGAAAAEDTPREIKVLTLEQALRIAAERNKDIRKAKEYFEWVKGKYVEERAAVFPQLTLSGSVARQEDATFLFAGSAFPATMTARSAEATVTQALFTWGQVGAAIRAAKEGFQVAEERLRQSVQAAYREVSVTFYDILLAREMGDIARRNLEQKTRHLDEARRKYAAGVATDYDVLAAEVAVENARPEVIRTENLLRSGLDRLRYLLALEEGSIEVSGTLKTDPEPVPPYGQILPVAVENRPEVRELRRRISIAEELRKIAGAGDKPRLDLQGGFGWRWYQAADESFDGRTWNVGVALTFPLFDGQRTKGRVAQAESETKSLRIEEAKLVDSISLQSHEAVNAVREAAEIVKALSGTVAQAEKLLFLSEKGYELGVKIRLEVEDAELKLREARANLARSWRDYRVARINLLWVMGELTTLSSSGSSPPGFGAVPQPSPLSSGR